jgi:glycosyltransferase involved in cell wall biosynthesis
VYVPRFAFPLIPCAKRLGKKVVVHLHDYIPISYTATVLAPYEERKHRIVLDDTMLECMKSFKHCTGVSLLWWLPKLVRRWISQADKIICVSKRQAEIIADQAPELRDKIEVVYNPLPPEIINAEPRKELDNTPTFLYVGGDSYIKGFHILLQTLNKLGKQGVKARFILTNRYSPRSLELLKQLSDKYRNLEIQVLGRIEYSKLIELHRKTWALLFPSIWEEPLPYAIIETSLLGTIPIASKVGGVLELLAGSPASDFLFSPGNVEELADKVLLLINNKNTDVIDVIRELGYDIRDHIAKVFNLRTIESQILRVFTEE